MSICIGSYDYYLTMAHRLIRIGHPILRGPLGHRTFSSPASSTDLFGFATRVRDGLKDVKQELIDNHGETAYAGMEKGIDSGVVALEKAIDRVVDSALAEQVTVKVSINLGLVGIEMSSTTRNAPLIDDDSP